VSTEIDFTTMRKGRRTRGSRVIDYCPKCGAKGERLVLRDRKTKEVTGYDFTHKAKIERVMGIDFVEVTASCFVTVQKPTSRLGAQPHEA
jgi:hypothetical protein